MDRIITPGSVAIGSRAPVPVSGTPQFCADGTVWPAYQANALQEEIRNVILDGGLTPDRTIETQLRDAIRAVVTRLAVNLQFIQKNAASWSPVAADKGKQVLFTACGVNTHPLTLPDAAAVGANWFIDVQVDSADGDYVPVAFAAGGQTFNGPSKLGSGTNVRIITDGANYFAKGTFRYPSAYGAFSAGALNSFAHGWGVTGNKLRAMAKLKNITTEHGYSVDDIIDLLTFTADNSNGMATFIHNADGNTSSLNVTTGIGLSDKAAHTDIGFLTTAKWNFQIIVELEK